MAMHRRVEMAGHPMVLGDRGGLFIIILAQHDAAPGKQAGNRRENRQPRPAFQHCGTHPDWAAVLSERQAENEAGEHEKYRNRGAAI